MDPVNTRVIACSIVSTENEEVRKVKGIGIKLCLLPIYVTHILRHPTPHKDDKNSLERNAVVLVNIYVCPVYQVSHARESDRKQHRLIVGIR